LSYAPKKQTNKQTDDSSILPKPTLLKEVVYSSRFVGMSVCEQGYSKNVYLSIDFHGLFGMGMGNRDNKLSIRFFCGYPDLDT